MLHDPTMSSFGVRSGHPFGTRRPDSSGTIAYVLYAIVFRETSGRHTRTLFAVLSFLLGQPPQRQRSSSVFRELYESHFAPGSCSPVGSSRFSSGRYRLSPFFPFFFPPSVCSTLLFYGFSLPALRFLSSTRLLLVSLPFRNQREKKRGSRPSCAA